MESEGCIFSIQFLTSRANLTSRLSPDVQSGYIIHLYKLYQIVSNGRYTSSNENFLVLPLFKTKASVKIIGGGGLAAPFAPPSVRHCLYEYIKGKHLHL